MKQKLISLCLAVALTFALAVPAAAAPVGAQDSATLLYNLGLFRGAGVNPDGSPQFDLDRAPTRAEAVTILVRLLGKEAEAQSKSWTTPFTDVPDWAKPYVGYAYAQGYANGMAPTLFGSSSPVSAAQFLTFLLRALGYQDSVDFTWNASWRLTDKLGITQGQYNAQTAAFLRADAADVSASALYALKKGQDKTLLQDLLASGAITGSTVVIWDYDALLFKEDFASFLFYPVAGSPASFTSFKLDKVTVNGPPGDHPRGRHRLSGLHRPHRRGLWLCGGHLRRGSRRSRRHRPLHRRQREDLSPAGLHLYLHRHRGRRRAGKRELH